MLRFDLVLEDIEINADRDFRQVDKWELRVRDKLSGQSTVALVDDLECMAIVGLAIAGDNDDGEAEMTMEALRHIAEPIVGKWPTECRPYP